VNVLMRISIQRINYEEDYNINCSSHSIEWLLHSDAGG